MAAAKLLAVFLLALVFTSGVFADAGIGGEDLKVEEAAGSDGGEVSGLKIQVDELDTKIRALESQIDEKTRELKAKEELIAEKEKLLEEKLDKIASLQAEVSSLQKKGSSDAAQQVTKAQARASELEKQIEILKKEVESKNKEKESTEARSSEAEKKLSELNLKLQKLQKTNEEQKNKIRKLERALKVAEEEMLRLKHEAASKTKELLEVHGAWLPPWLAVHWINFRTLAETHWNMHGKPALETVIVKVTETKAHAEKWAEPHLETVKTKYIPAVQEKWVTVRTCVEPHVQTLSIKAREAYDASKTAVTPHVVKVQEFVDPYYQEAKRFSKPYIDQAATVTKPHVDKMRVAMKPYTKKIIHVYRVFLKSASTYHHQVQAAINEKLKKHELTEPLATKEFVWFAASALLALPIYVLYKFLCSVFCKKTQKRPRHPHHHSRRKAKRGHSDN